MSRYKDTALQIKSNVQAAFNAVLDCGGTVPTGATSVDLATAIRSIQWYCLSYTSEYGTSPSPKAIPKNHILTNGDLPTMAYDDYSFKGWWDENFTRQYQAGDEITTDTQLTAKWIPMVTISYQTQVGTAPASKQVEQGYVLTAADVAAMQVTGFTFNGWWNSTKTHQYQAGDVINENVTLVANWTEIYYVAYATEHGTAPAGKYVSKGYTLKAADLPNLEDEDYKFKGWINASTGQAYSVGYVVNSNITLTASWGPAGGIYGVSWDGSSSSVMTRTDDAATFSNPVPYVKNATNYSSPFDDIEPWSGMVKETVSGLGQLVKIPKYYYKWTKSSNTMKLQISPVQQDGFLVSPAHADRGDGKGERDYVYVGRYHCSTSNYQSTSGVKPKASITRSAARTAIHNLNSNAWQLDYAMFWTVNMLYLVEFADWDSQSKIGYGCGNNSGTENSGKTDSMPYHTGTMQTSRSTYGTGIQYRYIEDWWANVFDWVDGIYFGGTSKKTVYVINKPASFSDSSGGTNVGTRATSDGFIKTWTNPTASGYQWALYPASINSSEAYVKDKVYFYSSGVVLYFGGYYDQSANYGAFYLDGNNTASYSGGYIGCRLQYLP